MQKWEAAKESILDYIKQHKLKPGDKLLSDKKLMEEINCKKQTFIRAMQFLAEHGQIRRQRGSKTIYLARQPVLANKQDYSFSLKATQVYNNKLETQLLELSSRMPQNSDEVNEKAAHKALGLKRNEPFIVISRLRRLDCIPRVIHRSFLNPMLFPSSFLIDHDFEKISLINTFDDYGYKLVNRETKLQARNLTEAEISILKCEQMPILSSEQIITARTKDGTLVVLEVMFGCYVDWVYLISNR